MILNKADYNHYIKLDMQVYGRTRRLPRFFHDETWCFLFALRKHEYHHNQHGKYHLFMDKVWNIVHRHYGVKMGWDIPVNTFGPGLKINHFGLIVVNPNARIGAFCDIHQGVNIGQHGDDQWDVPTIGDNVWIGPGAKIFGRITIADGCAIGANAVVSTSFNEEHISIAGYPATKVSNKGNRYIKTER
ncbi:serine O-acetyltransferase [Prevotella sp. RM4]|uniref:serine O-acetyltransferase n=1 Tax=Prevotella sp. RM4 TaxID=1200547 RepID=UPI00051B6482|nr:hypothetical protein [Prevotella sp. RM4]